MGGSRMGRTSFGGMGASMPGNPGMREGAPGVTLLDHKPKGTMISHDGSSWSNDLDIHHFHRA